MRLFVAVTDNDWFALLASKARVDEVNFWRPSPEAPFRALEPGEILLFKLHAPDNYIAGGGFYTRFLHLPLNLAWEAFADANGVRSVEEFRTRIAKLRHTPGGTLVNPQIGCILLAEPFFWQRSDWIRCPGDFAANTVVGKGYDSEVGQGRDLWGEVSERLNRQSALSLGPGPATVAAIESRGYGKPHVVQPRLGQGLFRVLVTDAYSRRCAMTGERTLPVLEAAHIKPFRIVQRHDLSNGLLLRSDLHRLFDEGYITIDADHRCVVVSRRIREEFENGRDYYSLDKKPVAFPSNRLCQPARDNLLYHAEHVFR